jgi:hypothetical protein
MNQKLLVKVKVSLYPSGQALGFPEIEAPRISRRQAHEGGKVVSPTHRPPLPPGDIPGAQFCWPEELSPNEPIRNRTRDLLACSAVS